jgi:prophage regulatory protein
MEDSMQHTQDKVPPDLTAPILLRMPSVIQITGLGRSTIYRLVAEQKFPSPVRLGERAVAWRRSEIDAWSETRPVASH